MAAQMGHKYELIQSVEQVVPINTVWSVVRDQVLARLED